MIRINNLFILRFFSLYTILTAFFIITGLNIIKYTIFVITIFCILLLTKYILMNIKLVYKKFIIYILLLTFLLAISLLVNIFDTKISFTIKYFGIYVFFLSGLIINLKDSVTIDYIKNKKLLIYSIVSIPFIVYFFDIVILHKEESNSIFINRNNAVLFGVITSYYILIFYKRINFYFIFIYGNIIIYKTLGAFLASIISLLVIYLGKMSPKKIISIFISMIIILSISFYLYNYAELAIIERLKGAIKGFQYFFAFDNLSQISKISYAQMALDTGHSDLSFLFRIKHWLDIVIAYVNSDLIHCLFGHGNDSIIKLTNAELRAHNDYLRMLFEVGFFYVVLFISFNLYLLKKIGLNIYSLPFLIVLMYFSTENLIDNFLAMSMLYYFIGLIIALKIKGELE